MVVMPLIPSEAAVPFGSHVVPVMASLVLTAAWLARCLLDARPAWHVGPVDAALALFFASHSLSALVMLPQGHARPMLNALWVWVSFALLLLSVRQMVRDGVAQWSAS